MFDYRSSAQHAKMSILPPDRLIRQVNIPAGAVNTDTDPTGILPLDYDWGPDGPPPEPPELRRQNAEVIEYIIIDMSHDRPPFCSPRPVKKAKR